MRELIRFVGTFTFVISSIVAPGCFDWDPLSAYSETDDGDLDADEPGDRDDGELKVSETTVDDLVDVQDQVPVQDVDDSDDQGSAGEDVSEAGSDDGEGDDLDASVEVDGSDAAVAQCNVDEDCAAGAPACQFFSCIEGVCVVESLEDEAPCDDGDACTEGEACHAGTCTGGVSKTCTALDACHEVGPCDPASGECSNPVSADGKGCDDGFACTEDDACQGGVCVGTAVTCGAPDVACAVATCQESAQGCVIDASDCECSNDDACGPGHVCVEGSCECLPSCEGRDCGSDGCGGTCGTCEPGQACSLEGACVCQPDCMGKVCGSDGCGGTCGGCATGLVCSGAGLCVCVPDCASKACGADGCGGTCGSCPAGEACDASGQCVCQPQCAGKQCGDNGCGTGQCGVCASGLQCSPAGTCVEPTCGSLGVDCPQGFTCTSWETCESGTSNEVFVPAGTFWMGCNATKDGGCKAGELPQHEVTLSAYFIDRTEVTAAQWSACIAAGACTTPIGSDPALSYGVPGREQHPINGINWSQAKAYCEWSGKPSGKQRLCREAEWERAARGGCELATGDCKSQMLTYPWGNSPAPACSVAVMNVAGDGCATGGPLPVGSKPDGRSPYGALDMSGNVAEWLADWYGEFDAAPVSDPTGPMAGEYRLARNGAYNGFASQMRAALRSALPPSYALPQVGVRCCRSAP